MSRTWLLLGPDRKPHESGVAGALGGHRGSRIYGTLDCRVAARAIARGGYVKSRVFFADEDMAIAAGYRPCGIRMPEEYAVWKATRSGDTRVRPSCR
jgi:hypothetical protein